MAAVADPGIATGMFGRRVKGPGCRHRVTSLANAGALGIAVLTLAAGISEEYLGRLPGGLVDYVSADQENIGALAGGGVFGVIFHVGAVAVHALYVLPLEIVAFLAGMTVGADVQFVRRAASHLGAARVGAQQESVSAAECCKVGAAVNRAAM